jgi:hypothetical protein
MKAHAKKRASQGKRSSKKKEAQGSEAAEVYPRFAPVVEAFANEASVVRKKMFSSSNVLTVKGKIFAMLSREKFVAKLPKERVDEIVNVRKGERFNPGHGRLMKEWVAVEGDRQNWIALAKEAYEFVKGGGT